VQIFFLLLQRLQDVRALAELPRLADPQFVLGHFALANLLAQTGQPERARKALENVTRWLDTHPRDTLLPEGDMTRMQIKASAPVRDIYALFGSQARKLIVEANRNGFLYVLDRTDGKFLSATRFSEKLNWANGIDEKGRPIRSELKPTEKGTRICPGMVGATNWHSPAFNPETSLFYFMALESCNIYKLRAQKFVPGQTYYATGASHSETDRNQKILLAYSIEGDKPKWRYVQSGNGHSSAGVMTTAGGLVFFGDDAQSFEAVDTVTGKSLWHFNTGQNISASPMTYAVNSKQFVAVAAGSDIFAFTLP
jgi:alcohol dehydrogenase (cytochrome c)